MRYIVLPFVLSLCPTLAVAQQPQNSISSRLIEKLPPGEREIADNDPTARIYSVQRLVEKILALKDVRAKAIGAARLANVLWEHDEPYARLLFEKALNTIEQNNDETLKRFPTLRRNVIAILAKRDSDWAKRLIDAAAGSNDAKARTNIDTALRLLEENPELAVQFAERSLQGGINPAFLQFLLDFRKTQEAGANQLFVQMLAYVSQQQITDIKELHSLGIYLFTAPDLLDSDNYAITRVGDILVPNISANRPGISGPTVRAYLQTAVGMLWRAVSDTTQAQRSYAFAYLLLPKSREFAPELTSSIEAVLSTLSTTVPPGLRQESSFKYINAAPLTNEERLANAENKPDAESRDIAYLDTALQAWRRGDFKIARTAAGRLSDPETSRRLSVLIDFGEGAWLLKRDSRRIADSKALANKLPQGIERTVLFLSIGQALAKNKDLTAAAEAIDSALKAGRLIGDARRPFLALIAAGRLTSLDPSAAQFVLTEVIKDFNSFDENEIAAVDWAQIVESGPLKARFPLDIASVDFSFAKACRTIALADLEAAMAKAEELQDENLRGQGLVEIGAVVLERLSRKSLHEQQPIRVGEDGIRKSASKIVMPNYPQDALNKRQQGVAVVEVQYDGQGNVSDVSVLEAPTNSIGEAVVVAVKQWKFTPSKKKDGTPVSIRGKLTFYFEIDKAGKAIVKNPKQFAN